MQVHAGVLCKRTAICVYKSMDVILSVGTFHLLILRDQEMICTAIGCDAVERFRQNTLHLIGRNCSRDFLSFVRIKGNILGNFCRNADNPGVIAFANAYISVRPEAAFRGSLDIGVCVKATHRAPVMKVNPCELRKKTSVGVNEGMYVILSALQAGGLFHHMLQHNKGDLREVSQLLHTAIWFPRPPERPELP